MYIPRHFEENNVEVLRDLIRREPLGTLVMMTPDGMQASHVPFELDPEPAPFGTLRCHVARANPLWKTFSADVPALILFQGAHSYISPAWYAAKAEHGKVVPTWDYVVVHCYGTARAVQDAGWLRKMVEDLTNRHEAGRADPWRVSDAPAEYIDKLLAAIVGLEIPVARMLGKRKLSQNRSLADRQGVVAGLRRESDRDSAADIAAMIDEINATPRG